MRVLLIDPEDRGGQVLARRLRAQGYRVDVHINPASGASAALSDPPSAVIADLWMPGISGVQLCRLLGSEPSTTDVPVILRAATDEPRNQFWAQRAGATEYVQKGRIGVLVRALERSIDVQKGEDDGFFTHLPDGQVDIRDRIAAQLDQALFDSVVAAEVRALGTCGSFDRLFDLFSQLVVQVTSYRWMAIYTEAPKRLGLHAHPACSRQCLEAARRVIDLTGRVETLIVEDEDARAEDSELEPIVAPISFGNKQIGWLALAPARQLAQDANLVPLLAQEIGGPLQMAKLVEESQRLAATDALTGLSNRRSFGKWLDQAVTRAQQGAPISVALLDIDHFKQVNDNYGHAVGDTVLRNFGALLLEMFRVPFRCARWGGEEFVLAMPSVGPERAEQMAERLRQAICDLVIDLGDGQELRVSASIGVAHYTDQSVDDLIDQADHAMYDAKTSGRNRVRVAGRPPKDGEQAA